MATAVASVLVAFFLYLIAAKFFPDLGSVNAIYSTVFFSIFGILFGFRVFEFITINLKRIGRYFHVDTYEVIVSFDRQKMTVLPSLKPLLQQISWKKGVTFEPFEGGLSMFDPLPLPIDENSVFSATYGITYRYGLRQSQSGFEINVDEPPISPEISFTEQQKIGYGNLPGRTAAALNEILRLIRDDSHATGQSATRASGKAATDEQTNMNPME